MKAIFLGLLLFTSCSLIPERSRERQIQTDIIASLTEKSSQFANCVSDNKLFDKFNVKRIRIVLFLSIDSNGQVEKFRLDEQKYPNEFSECMFKVVDTTVFPKIKSHEIIELEQPFIFSKK